MKNQVVSPQQWEAARQQLLVKEKELTRARDAMAATRRRMPWTRPVTAERKQSRAWRTGFVRIAAMTIGESTGQTPCPSIAVMGRVEHCTQVTPDPHRMDQAGVPGAMVVPALRGRCGWPARQHSWEHPAWTCSSATFGRAFP